MSVIKITNATKNMTILRISAFFDTDLEQTHVQLKRLLERVLLCASLYCTQTLQNGAEKADARPWLITHIPTGRLE